MPSLSRRGFLAAGGAGLAGAALGACGTEEAEPSAARDVELLGAALATEQALSRTYRFAADAVGGGDAVAVRELARGSKRRLGELSALLEQQGGSPEDVEPSPPSGAETALEGAALDLTSAIAAHREAAALLSEPDQRRTVYGYVAEDAAELALVHSIVGEPEAPTPFVTGGEPKPHVSPAPLNEEDE